MKAYLIVLTGLLLSFAAQAYDASADVRTEKLSTEQKPAFLPIARNSFGYVLTMTQWAAVQYCYNQGGHLPSARELIQWSISFGAKGFVDSCDTGDANCFSVRNIENADGEKVQFSFSRSGYQAPAGELGTNWFWSSSVHSKFPDFSTLLFAGDRGSLIRSHGPKFTAAVLCVVGR